MFTPVCVLKSKLFTTTTTITRILVLVVGGFGRWELLPLATGGDVLEGDR